MPVNKVEDAIRGRALDGNPEVGRKLALELVALLMVLTAALVVVGLCAVFSGITRLQ